MTTLMTRPGCTRCLGAAIAVLALASCGSKPPAPDWQMNAHGAAEKATSAYLAGDTRVAELEWSRARAEVARTGRPDRVARLELMRCAAQVASLDAQACSAFEALRADADPADQAYADYLSGRGNPAHAALLPAPQRAAAGNPASIATITDPLSRLVAAGVAHRAGTVPPGLDAVATDTASEQGWRRPLLAWLLLRAQRAEQSGDAEQAAALKRRIALVEKQGVPP